ncbi:4-hydroxyacetophenone monooxygenase, partial [Nocardia tengchongensis]
NWCLVYVCEHYIQNIPPPLPHVHTVGRGTVVSPRDVQDEYNAGLQRKLEGAVWSTGGCASWYLDKHGNNTTLWPDFTFRFRSLLEHFDVAAYETTTQPVAQAV